MNQAHIVQYYHLLFVAIIKLKSFYQTGPSALRYINHQLEKKNKSQLDAFIFLRQFLGGGLI